MRTLDHSDMPAGDPGARLLGPGPGTRARGMFHVLAGALLLAVIPPVAHAFTLTGATFSGGGISSAGGGYRLGATAGEAGVVGLTSGGSFRLIEGFWRPGLSVPSAVGDPDREGEPSAHEFLRFANEHGGAFPNPFAASTTIRFSVARPSRVGFAIYAADGRHARTLLDSDLPEGRHEVEWDGRDDAGRDLGAGVYFGRLVIGTWSSSHTVLHIR